MDGLRELVVAVRVGADRGRQQRRRDHAQQRDEADRRRRERPGLDDLELHVQGEAYFVNLLDEEERGSHLRAVVTASAGALLGVMF